MRNQNNKRTRESFLFDLLNKNLPKQEESEDESHISCIELLLWMIGIVAIIAVIKNIF
ncbi:MAG: hypothetical protein JXA06_04935 [Bacteroidetes bacterium]|nr:hypothetical protein [Bacteroidota bacterium]